MENIFKRSTYSSANPPVETETIRAHPLISWRSTIGGLLISLLAMGILLSLGLAFGGGRYVDASVNATPRDLGVFSSVWFLISAVISVLIGSYFAARVSKYHLGRIGAAQGAVIASLFFGFFLYQTVLAISGTGRMVSALASEAASAAQAGVSQAMVPDSALNNAIEDALGDLNLRNEPGIVFSGVASRLIAGDTNGAKNYLARQAGVSPQVVDARINQLQAQINQAMTQARQQAAKALQATGWALFLMLTLGTIAATAGGALGALANVRRPLARDVFAGERTEVVVTP